MSDIVYHPRIKMKASDWNLPYYSDPQNPFYAATAWYHKEARYAWGRFWEILDFYGVQPPVNLAYIGAQQAGVDSYEYKPMCGWWLNPWQFNTQATTYFETDPYLRGTGTDLGCIAFFRHGTGEYPADYYCGIVERYTDINDFTVSRWNYQNAQFEMVQVINQQTVIQGDACVHVGTIYNPLLDGGDDFVPGKYVGWPAWIFYLKRKLMMQRGEIL